MILSVPYPSNPGVGWVAFRARCVLLLGLLRRRLRCVHVSPPPVRVRVQPGHAAALTGKARELSGLHDQAVRDRAATMPSAPGTRDSPWGPTADQYERAERVMAADREREHTDARAEHEAEPG